MKNKFSERILLLRREKGWSQKETAAKLGISQALLSHYEKGIRECGLDFLIKAADVFSCSTDYILGIIETDNIKLPKNDADSISADLKLYPALTKGRDDAVNTLSLLYSITARIGNPEICKDFNKTVLSNIYLISRMLENLYFDSENFKKDKLVAISLARSKGNTALSSLISDLYEKNINVNLSKNRIKDEYAVCSKSFNNIISLFEE